MWILNENHSGFAKTKTIGHGVNKLASGDEGKQFPSAAVVLNSLSVFDSGI
jgi:hypothetical protein